MTAATVLWRTHTTRRYYEVSASTMFAVGVEAEEDGAWSLGPFEFWTARR